MGGPTEILHVMAKVVQFIMVGWVFWMAEKTVQPYNYDYSKQKEKKETRTLPYVVCTGVLLLLIIGSKL